MTAVRVTVAIDAETRGEVVIRIETPDPEEAPANDRDETT